MKYIRLTEGLNDKGKLIQPETLESYIKDRTKDYYTSIFYYDENHLKRFKETGTVSGIEDVKTDKLVFDFDNEFNIDLARFDTLEAIARLNRFNINEENIEIYFSGNKGFSVVAHLDRELTPKEALDIALNKIGYGLKTLDKKIYNASRIFRVPSTQHPKSHLYKIPLSLNDLQNASIDDIKEAAKDCLIGDTALQSKPIPDLFKVEVKKNNSTYSLDLTQKPSSWKNCKWSLLQGNFGDEPGERHQALTVLAATCRGLGFDKDTTYYMCKSALKKQALRTKREEFPKEELWKNIIEDSIFGDNWNGGQYTCKKDPWLHDYCEALGEDKCDIHEDDEGPSVDINDLTNKFFSYAKDFEKNKINFGIPEFDQKVTLCTSTLVGLLGQPGAGKTSMALQFLKNTSDNTVPSMFFSMDMGEPIIYAKMIQNNAGLNFDEVMHLFKDDVDTAKDIAKETNDKYKNVSMNFRSGLTVKDIKNSIEAQNKINGVENKVKLVIIDYLECISGPYSDATANTGFIANQLKDVANELQVCILLLLQTQKHSTPDVSDPLLSLKGVKGSSLIEQSCSVIITLWREGYGPEYVNDDKYISFATVKNRFGALWKNTFSWEGKRGAIASLGAEGLVAFKDFQKRKEEMKRQKLMDDKMKGWDE